MPQLPNGRNTGTHGTRRGPREATLRGGPGSQGTRLAQVRAWPRPGHYNGRGRGSLSVPHRIIPQTPSAPHACGGKSPS